MLQLFSQCRIWVHLIRIRSSPMNIWDVRLKDNARVEFRVPAGWTTALFVLNGGVRLETGEIAGAAEVAVLEREDETLGIEALEDTTLLFLSGQPIDEPVVGEGP